MRCRSLYVQPPSLVQVEKLLPVRLETLVVLLELKASKEGAEPLKPAIAATTPPFARSLYLQKAEK
jgi:hypothetical protein